jgi:hypothetical protein
MLQKLVDTALARRWWTAALALIVVVAGVWSFITLPIDAFPEIAPTQVKLIQVLAVPADRPTKEEASQMREAVEKWGKELRKCEKPEDYLAFEEALKQQELVRSDHQPLPAMQGASASARIEIADLKERIRKLEAIAAGVDL